MPNNQEINNISHFKEISGGIVDLKNLLKDQHENVNLIHVIALNDLNLYKKQNYIRILNQNFEFDVGSYDIFENYEELKNNLEEVQRNLNLLISEDTILHQYVDGNYCQIDINPKVPKIEHVTKGIPFKDQAIIMSMLEFSNYIVKIFDFMCCPKRNVKIVLLTKKIYAFLTQMIEVADANDKDDNGLLPYDLVQLQTTLRHIVSEIRQLFALILCDAFNFAIFQNENVISTWCETYERNGFARNYNLISNETLNENKKSDAPFEDVNILKTNLPNTSKWIGSTTESFIEESLRSKLKVGEGSNTLKYGQFMGVKFAQLLTIYESIDLPETIQYMDAGYFLYNLKLKFKILANLKYLSAKNLSSLDKEGIEAVLFEDIKNEIWGSIVEDRTEIQNKKNLIKSASYLKPEVTTEFKWEPDVIFKDAEIFDLVHAYFKNHSNKEGNIQIPIEENVKNISNFGDYITNKRMDIEIEIITDLICYLLQPEPNAKGVNPVDNLSHQNSNCSARNNKINNASKSNEPLDSQTIKGGENSHGLNSNTNTVFQSLFDQFCRDFVHFKKHNTNVYFPTYIALYRSLTSPIA